MPPLPTDLRTQLERTVVAARDTADTAARQPAGLGRPQAAKDDDA